MVAWIAPRTWTTGETVTSTMLNEQVRDDLLHIAGTSGFSATVSSEYGVQPAAGYFAGGNLQNYHIEGGLLVAGIVGYTTQAFARAFVSAPVVVARPSTTYDWGNVYITSITTAKFTIYSNGESVYWLAWGTDT